MSISGDTRHRLSDGTTTPGHKEVLIPKRREGCSDTEWLTTIIVSSDSFSRDHDPPIYRVWGVVKKLRTEGRAGEIDLHHLLRFVFSVKYTVLACDKCATMGCYSNTLSDADIEKELLTSSNVF